MNQSQERIAICISKISQYHSSIKHVFDEIYQQGGRVLLVGGAVRDCLLGCLNSDFDFEIYHLSFEELEYILKKFGKVCFVGKSFGVLRLEGIDADWSIPRSDSVGRKPVVHLDPDMSFAQAFRRRDLTINAMGIDVASLELIDPYDGVSDLGKKVLRSPDVTFFVQDPLRFFRVMQFVARFDMHVDSVLTQVCQTMDLSTISIERIEQELYKLFSKANHPSKGFLWLAKMDRLTDIFPAVRFDEQFYKRIDTIAQHYNFKSEQKIIVSFALIAYGLQHDSLQHVHCADKITVAQTQVINGLLKQYITSHNVMHTAAMISWYIRYVPLINDVLACKWLAHWTESYFSLQFLADVAACWYGSEISEKFIQLAKHAKVLHHAEEPLLQGQDLLDYAQGKELGELIKKAYALQLQDSIHDKAKLLKNVLKK
ncbi:CCA tRNA nucleotidyltransferase [Candidatus Babeliales bacterium]|nr:CCA tRNA nucleotidyltransferase [Candidatus Babeliales bacterium]